MSYNGYDGEKMPLTSPAAAALEDLRGTVKWLVGAAGGTAVVLVGGLQLTRLHDVNTPAGRTSAAAAAVAIGLALWLLVAAAKILAVPRLSATQISDREINTGALDPDSPVAPDDKVVRWVQQHGEHLLAGERTVTDLCSVRAEAQKALRDLHRNRTVEWNSAQVTPDDTEASARIGDVLQDADAALIAVEDAVHHHQCQDKLTTLLKWFPYAGCVFVLAVIVFAIASVS